MPRFLYAAGAGTLGVSHAAEVNVDLDPWSIWLLISLVLLAIEIMLVGAAGGLLLAWSLMAFAAMLAALGGANLTMQLVTAGVVGLVAMPAMIWMFRRTTEGVAGATTVKARITRRHGKLGVVVRGDFFAAEHADGRELHEGEEVIVQDYKGLTALVRHAEP